MNANAVTKHYGSLTPQERFRLILAASGRGDEAERDRLTNAGGRITLSMPVHAPYAQAFNELSLMTFIELLEEAASYQEAFAIANDTRNTFCDDEAEGEEESDDSAAEENPKADERPAQEDAVKEPVCVRALDVAFAAGYMLRTKANGWKLFCERLNVPPLLLWEVLPGFDRVQRALALTEKAAFVSEGFLVWLNRVRPKGKPKLTTVPLTVEGMADANEEAFRRRVEWWGG
jgi:hypothetical protein